MTGKPVRLAYFVTHPIQYQAPLLRLIAQEPSIELKVFFATGFSLRRHYDPGFGRDIAWDIDLLGGYDHEFLPVLGRDDRLSPFRPFNYGILARLIAGRFDAVWCHSCVRLPHLAALVGGRLLGKRTFLRDEASRVSSRPSPRRLLLKKAFLWGLKHFVSGNLVIGTLNREYYRDMGFPEDRLFPVPYAVDNGWFRARIAEAAARREEFRAELGVEPGRPIALYAAKFIPRKRCDDLIRAFARIADDPAARRPCLLIVGDGEQRDRLHALAREAPEGSVRFLGFRGQTELPPLYDICDVFVLP